MVNEVYELVWTKPSQQLLLATYKYISKDAPLNAKKVIDDIVTATEKQFLIQNITHLINTKQIMMGSIVLLKNIVIEYRTDLQNQSFVFYE